jgi:hypothetical protein
MPEVQELEIITLHGIDYVVFRKSEVPTFPNRFMLFARRPNGRTNYTFVKYETGKYSRPVAYK